MSVMEDIGLIIKCPFCNAKQDAEVLAKLELSMESGYSTGSDEVVAEATFEVACSSCKRLIYKKEVTKRENA